MIRRHDVPASTPDRLAALPPTSLWLDEAGVLRDTHAARAAMAQATAVLRDALGTG